MARKAIVALARKLLIVAWRMLLTGEVYRAVRATTVARKHRELQKKIWIQLPSTGASSGSRARHPTAESIRRENGGSDESTANTRFDLTSLTGGNVRLTDISRNWAHFVAILASHYGGKIMSRNRALLVLAVTASTAILIMALGGWPRVTGAPAPAQSIVGSWVGHPRGAEGFASGPILITFTSDGIVLWSNSNPSSSGGHGVWVSTGNRTVAATLIFFVHNAHGDFVGTRKLRTKFTLNTAYDEYHSLGAADFFDAQGMQTGSANFIGDGTRIKAEPPNFILTR